MRRPIFTIQRTPPSYPVSLSVSDALLRGSLCDNSGARNRLSVAPRAVAPVEREPRESVRGRARRESQADHVAEEPPPGDAAQPERRQARIQACSEPVCGPGKMYPR